MSGRYTSSQRFRLVVAGGGVAALEAILALRALAADDVDLTLVAPEPHFWYRPLAVVEPFGAGAVERVELAEVAEQCRTDFTLGAIVAVDDDTRVAVTAVGARFEYDALLLAIGTRSAAAVPAAVTFRGPADTPAVAAVVGQLRAGEIASVAFAVPGGVTWPLPLYELALQTALVAEEADLKIATPETAPLEVFGRGAAAAVRGLLAARGIAFGQDGAGDRVIALPRLEPPHLEGVPRDENGFVPTDRHGRVAGLDRVFAAGDMTSFPVKQGGLAAQQADAAAATIAAAAGVACTPRPFEPVLRALLVTGAEPLYLEATFVDGAFETSAVDTDPLWWPPSKIVGRYLAGYVAERAHVVGAR